VTDTDRRIRLVGEHARYCLMVHGDPTPVESYERDAWGSGAILAANRAAALSAEIGGVVLLYVGDRYLARYIRGRWVQGGAT
jgi:hypothetical protein